MTYVRTPAAEFAAKSAAGTARIASAHPGQPPRRATRLTRRYEVSGLTRAGLLSDFNAIAPASHAFESAFAGFARGTLISTTAGPVAVEDLIPGTMLETAGNGPQKLLWIGSMMIFPGLPDMAEDAVRLTRITADSFGIGRPFPDLMLGPRARMLHRSGMCRTRIGSEHAFAPASAFIDGSSMISVKPAAPVRVYHLALEGQQILRANGMEVESFHPGRDLEKSMDPGMLELFLGLFPHVRSLEDFGMMGTPRLTTVELDEMDAA